MAASVEDVSELAPAQQPRRGSQLSQRSGKISLPAKISDLYQTYPGDGEGMVQVSVLYCTVLYLYQTYPGDGEGMVQVGASLSHY